MSRYEVLAPIGQGGVAGVFVGRARGAAGFSRLVALKRAHPHLAHDESFVQTMKHEAQLASRIHHPNVVSVLDVEIDDGEPVLVLDYVEGCSLSALIPRLEPLRASDPRLAARIALRIVLDVAAGLGAAHKTRGDDGEIVGIVHRDVSPSNVLVGMDGISRIADFGIAKASASSGDRTESGVLKGKLAYMAPEYVERQTANARSDLFSLGIVAWEALTGKRLFRGSSDIDTVARIMRARIPPLADANPDLAVLDPVLGKALAIYASDRYPTVAAFAEALESSARAADLVGPHASVGEIVEREFGEMLALRRRGFASTDGQPASVPSAPPPPPPRSRGRDDQATVSVVASTFDVAGPASSGSSRGAVVPLPAPTNTRGGSVVGFAIAGVVVLVLAAVAALLLVVGSIGRSAATGSLTTVEPSALPPETASAAAPPPPPTTESAAEPETVPPPATTTAAPRPKEPKRPPPVRATTTVTTPQLVPKKAGPNPYASGGN